MVSASCGIEGKRILAYKPLLDEALRIAQHKPGMRSSFSGIWSMPSSSLDTISIGMKQWPRKPHDCVSVAATDPLYILYTFGTTGQPKGVVRDNGGHAVALKWTMKSIDGVDPGDVFWAASMSVGSWAIPTLFMPRCCTGTPPCFTRASPWARRGRAFWRVILSKSEALFTAPTAFRAIKKEDPTLEFNKKYDLSNFRALFLAGERCDADTLRWAPALLRPRDRSLVADGNRLVHLRKLHWNRDIASQARVAHEAGPRHGCACRR